VTTNINGDTQKSMTLLNFQPTPTSSTDVQPFLNDLKNVYIGFSVVPSGRRLLTSSISVSTVSFCGNSGESCGTSASGGSGAIIGVAVGISIVVIIIIALVVAFCCCGLAAICCKSSKTDEEDPFKKQAEMTNMEVHGGANRPQAETDNLAQSMSSMNVDMAMFSRSIDTMNGSTTIEIENSPTNSPATTLDPGKPAPIAS